jgi:phage shock protein E
MLNMKKWLLNNKLTVIGAIAGAIGGYLYYYFVGCASGTCGITSSPVNSTLYFAILGGLIVNLIKPTDNSQKENSNM